MSVAWKSFSVCMFVRYNQSSDEAKLFGRWASISFSFLIAQQNHGEQKLFIRIGGYRSLTHCNKAVDYWR